MSILPRMFKPSDDERMATLERKLLRFEAEVGGRLFGPVGKGQRREFFCLDAHTWIWHEEWTDKSGQRHVVTTRYDVRPNGILKSQGNQMYTPVSTDEARNLLRTAGLYYQEIAPEYARMRQQAVTA